MARPTQKTPLVTSVILLRTLPSNGSNLLLVVYLFQACLPIRCLAKGIWVTILSTHLRLGVFPSGFPPISYMHYSSTHSCYMLCSSHPPLLGHFNYTLRRVQAMKLLIMKFSPTTRHFISLPSKYSPRHPLLKHPQPMFLP
jgi:hypothetical protein